MTDNLDKKTPEIDQIMEQKINKSDSYEPFYLQSKYTGWFIVGWELVHLYIIYRTENNAKKMFDLLYQHYKEYAYLQHDANYSRNRIKLFFITRLFMNSIIYKEMKCLNQFNVNEYYDTISTVFDENSMFNYLEKYTETDDKIMSYFNEKFPEMIILHEQINQEDEELTDSDSRPPTPKITPVLNEESSESYMTQDNEYYKKLNKPKAYRRKNIPPVRNYMDEYIKMKTSKPIKPSEIVTRIKDKKLSPIKLKKDTEDLRYEDVFNDSDIQEISVIEINDISSEDILDITKNERDEDGHLISHNKIKMKKSN